MIRKPQKTKRRKAEQKAKRPEGTVSVLLFVPRDQHPLIKAAAAMRDSKIPDFFVSSAYAEALRVVPQ